MGKTCRFKREICSANCLATHSWTDTRCHSHPYQQVSYPCSVTVSCWTELRSVIDSRNVRPRCTIYLHRRRHKACWLTLHTNASNVTVSVSVIRGCMYSVGCISILDWYDIHRRRKRYAWWNRLSMNHISSIVDYHIRSIGPASCCLFSTTFDKFDSCDTMVRSNYDWYAS